jgi:diguanylate cyclase (GGDEF)-like protein
VAGAGERDLETEARDREAEARDREAEVRDHDAEVRDDEAEARDRQAEARDRATTSDGPRDTGGGSSASDRAGSASDREHSASDRAASAAERVASSFDDLTGAYRRTPGMIEARREVARSRRSSQPLTFAFLDVDGLKAINDSLGHAAGDDLLRDVGRQIRRSLRSYDLLVRYGGDEFVCVLSDTTAEDATTRFDSVNAELAVRPVPGRLSVGVAELMLTDTAEDVLARADAAMYNGRSQRMGNRARRSRRR